MRLNISKSKNSIIYYVADAIRENGKVKTTIVEKIGTHKELLEKGIKDPLKYANDYVSKVNSEIKENIIPYSEKIDLKEELDLTLDCSKPTFKNIGWVIPLQIYKQLGISDFVASLSTNAKFDIDNIVKFLSISRIMNPCSKKATFESIDNYLFAKPYNLIDSYRTLEILSKNSDTLQKVLFEHSKEIVPVKADVLYYDCTNYYFETETEDDDIYNDDGDIIQWGLRKYGLSKEHRPNPIVQMGLFIDSNGIPISYSIAPGNTNEQTTAIPLERQMVKDYKHSTFIYCSDAGLGSYDIRFYNSLSNRHYVVTQSLKKTDEENLEYIFADKNWKYIDSDEKVSLKKFKEAIDKEIAGEELTNKEIEIMKYDMIYKMYPIKRTVPARFLKEFGINLSGKLEMDEVICITFSKKYYIYQKQIFNRQVEKAQEIVSKNKKVNNNNINSPKRFVDTMYQTENGEIAKERINMLDSKTIENEEMFHGFYALATNLDRSIKEILAINAQRWKIEQSFRILKSDFDARPAYVWNPDSIKGHFAICYIALLIYRLLENKLIQKNSSYKFSSNNIIKTIRNMNVIKKGELLYQAVYTNSNVLKALNDTFNIDLSKKHYRNKTLKDMFE